MSEATTRDGRGGVWPWLAPSAVLLLAMTVWGVLRYPELPARVPEHIGPDGVDAWTAKTVWAAFVPVFVYAGVTAAVAGSAVLTLRITPRDEMPVPDGRWAAAGSALTNRPASAASASRAARNLLVMNAVYGLAFLMLCWTMWRSDVTAALPGWLLPVTLAVFAAGLVPVLVAWRQDAAERKAAEKRSDGGRTTGGERKDSAPAGPRRPRTVRDGS